MNDTVILSRKRRGMKKTTADQTVAFDEPFCGTLVSPELGF
jgi:hypothetical protein